MLHVLCVEDLVTGKCIETTGCGNNDMGAFAFVAEDLGVLGDWGAAIKCADSYIWHVFGEPSIFVLDLKSKFSCVTKDQNRHIAIHGFKLLQGRKHEDRSFPMTRFCLAQHIHAQNGLRNAFLLDCQRKKVENQYADLKR